MIEFERRRKQRFATQLPLKIGIAGHGELLAVTRDISTGGIFFYADTWPEGVSQMRIEMVFPPEILSRNARAICEARVVRTEGRQQNQAGVAAVIDNYRWVTPE